MADDDAMVRHIIKCDRVFQNGTYVGEVHGVNIMADEVMLSNNLVVSASNLYPQWGHPNCWDLDPSVPVDREQLVSPASKRGDEWLDFSEAVFDHVENYTVKQYGDAGTDQVTHYSAEDCVKQIKKYCERFGKNAREGLERLDLIKIAHYACLASNKLGDE